MNEKSPVHTDRTASLPSKTETMYAISQALHTLDRHFHENIASYAEALQDIILEIEREKSELAKLNRHKEPIEREIRRFEDDIRSDLRLLERLSDNYLRKVSILDEIEREFETLRLSEEKRYALDLRRREIDELLREIEDIEISTLQKELDKQNLLQTIDPLIHEAIEIEHRIEALEARKRHMESTGLHRIRPSLPENVSDDMIRENDLIDTETE